MTAVGQASRRPARTRIRLALSQVEGHLAQEVKGVLGHARGCAAHNTRAGHQCREGQCWGVGRHGQQWLLRRSCNGVASIGSGCTMPASALPVHPPACSALCPPWLTQRNQPHAQQMALGLLRQLPLLCLLRLLALLNQRRQQLLLQDVNVGVVQQPVCGTLRGGHRTSAAGSRQQHMDWQTLPVC